jgi:hypothetical protein
MLRNFVELCMDRTRFNECAAGVLEHIKITMICSLSVSFDFTSAINNYLDQRRL